MQQESNATDGASNKSVMIFVGCAALALLVLCCASAGLFYFAFEQSQTLGGGPSGAPMPTQPDGAQDHRFRATVTQAMGEAPAPIGATCEVTVGTRQREGAGYWCRATVVCAGQLLFGGGNFGYFDCQHQAGPPLLYRGADNETTDQSGDAAFDIDTERGDIRVRDSVQGRAYSIVARLLLAE